MRSARVGLFGLALGLTLAAQADVPVREAYALHCSGCHGTDGRGDGRIVPSLHEIGPLLEAEGGRAYLVRVPGVAQAPLPSDALATLLNFVLREMAETDPVTPYTAAEVEALRGHPLRDPRGERPELREDPSRSSRTGSVPGSVRLPARRE